MIDYALPGGVVKAKNYSNYNYIVSQDHDIVTGILTDGKAVTNALLYSTYCSHTYFEASSLPADATVILEDGRGNATLVEYTLGNGRVIASGLTWEYNYVRDMVNGTSFAKSIYDDLIVYAVTASDPCDHALDEGEIVPRKADLRAFVLMADEPLVWASGLTRFSRNPDSFIVNSSQGGGFKDTWVLSR